MTALVDRLKKHANTCFEKEQYSKAVYLYNQAIARSPGTPVLLANRAAAYMKRKWSVCVSILLGCHIKIVLIKYNVLHLL